MACLQERLAAGSRPLVELVPPARCLDLLEALLSTAWEGRCVLVGSFWGRQVGRRQCWRKGKREAGVQLTGKPATERCAASLQRCPPHNHQPHPPQQPPPRPPLPPFLPQLNPCCRRAEGVRVPLYTALSTYLGVCNQAEGAGGPPVVLEALLQGEQGLGPWTTHSPLNVGGTHDTDKRTTGLRCPCLHWDQACCMRSAARSLHKVQAPVPLLGLLILLGCIASLLSFT